MTLLREGNLQRLRPRPSRATSNRCGWSDSQQVPPQLHPGSDPHGNWDSDVLWAVGKIQRTQVWFWNCKHHKEQVRIDNDWGETKINSFGKFFPRYVVNITLQYWHEIHIPVSRTSNNSTEARAEYLAKDLSILVQPSIGWQVWLVGVQSFPC